jgi:hypothetical protein
VRPDRNPGQRQFGTGQPRGQRPWRRVQATPASFTLEAVGVHRDQVSDAEVFTRIDSLDDYNRFRTAKYQDAVA